MASITGIVSNNFDSTHYTLSSPDSSVHSVYQSSCCFAIQKNAHIAEVGDFLLLFIGEPDWQGANSELPLYHEKAQQEFIETYKKNGIKVLEKITGHFAIAVINNKNGSCMLASDRVGVYRLYWHKTPQGDLVFSSELRKIKALCKGEFKISANAIYSYMYFHMVPTPLTIYETIQKLPPAQALSITDQQVSLETYWLPSFQEKLSANETTLAEQLMSSLESSVGNAMPKGNKSAAFLSGGIDSSTVVGMMSKLQSKKSDCYCIGFNAQEYDETPFARITADHFGVTLHEHHVTPDDVVNIVPSIAQTFEEPFGNSSAVPAYYCAKFAADDGVNTMLAGDGGDEVFAGNERYATQEYYQYYLGVPALIRKWLLDPLFLNLPDWLPLASKTRNYVSRANIPLPERLQVYNFLHQHAPEELFTTHFLKDVDTTLPIQIQQQQFQRPKNASNLNRMLYMDWQFTLADNDLRKVSTMCELAGVNVKYPLLADNILNFSLAIPSSLKIKNHKLRYFFKRAMRGFLNNKTLSKSKHGFGLPFGIWLNDYEPLNKLAKNSLEKLKERNIFNPDFIEKAVEMHSNSHAAYYGELIWILMMLELWLQKNIDQDSD